MSGFSDQAKEFAEDVGLELIDGDALATLIADQNRDKPKTEDLDIFSFFLPHFPGHPKSERPLRMLYGRDLWRSGGTGKAEHAKLPGAGIWPEAKPRKMGGGKRRVTELSANRQREQTLGNRACSRAVFRWRLQNS
jgi:hypothetical protein